MASDTKVAVTVSPFAVEADAPGNGDIIIVSIPGVRLRSRLRPNRTIKAYDRITGQERDVLPVDQTRALAALPEVPGMQIFVDPANLTYKVVDGMTPEQGEELARAMRRGDNAMQLIAPDKFVPVSAVEGKIDVHEMKTLVRELVRLARLDFVRVVKGVLPDMDDVDNLPGRYLYDPGARHMGFTLPRFEDEYADWVNRLTFKAG